MRFSLIDFYLDITARMLDGDGDIRGPIRVGRTTHSHFIASRCYSEPTMIHPIYHSFEARHDPRSTSYDGRVPPCCFGGE